MLRWYGHVKGRDVDYVGRTELEMKLPGKSKREHQRGCIWMWLLRMYARSSSKGR